MSGEPDLWLNGEQIPDTSIEGVFRQPPGVPLQFWKSALIVGPKGAGKSTLFRYLKLVHERRGGIACHICLLTEWECLHREIGGGALASVSPSTHLSKSA